jgi:SAM-dependent methyltransferase
MGWSEDAARNRERWTESNAEYTDARGSRKWAQAEITWHVWDPPETALRILGDVSGLDAVERRGTRPVGVDVTPARRCKRDAGLEFPLVEADAAATSLPDTSADLVHSERGGSIRADPCRWIPEAARLPRPGGRLVFMRHSPLLTLRSPGDVRADERLHRTDSITVECASRWPAREMWIARRR